MAIRRNGAVLRQIRTLFNVGAIGELTDGQLLERFARRDAETAELAFAALVERHGPMVLRVCRGVLRDSHDAQDAFQATFLVLIKKARALWVSESLGPWLHQVAYRTASCARSARVRRRKHEKGLNVIAADATSEQAVIVNDWEPVLHEEIARLPARYRMPMVLCELEGRTHEQAARHLGWPVGTVKSRLARGRLRLRDRLIRRGLAPCGALSVLISPPIEATAAIPPALANSTIWGAKTFATANVSAALPGLYSASVAALTKGVLRAMILTKLKIAALGVVSAGLVVTSVGIFAGQESVIKPQDATVQSKEATLVLGGGVEKRQDDLVADAIRLARGQISLMSAKELQVRAELESLRGELKNLQATLKEAQAQAKKPNEIEIINLEIANLQSEVRREESLLESVQNQLARYQVQATPGDVVTIAVSRSMLREMRDRLETLRNSMKLDLQQSEQGYRVLRMNGEKAGESKEQAARAEVEQKRIMFNSTVDQLKAMQFLIERADLPVRGRPAEKK